MPERRSHEQIIQTEIIDLLAQIEELLCEVRERVEGAKNEADDGGR